MNIKILADASLPLLHESFPAPFEITTYSDAAEIPDYLSGQDILIVRSTLIVNEHLLGNLKPKIVATASSGSDHLDQCFLSKKHITVFDAKGSNAQAVSDYILSSVAYLRVNALLAGNRIGIIGIGAVGTLISERLQSTGFEIIAYDPLRELMDCHFKSAAQDSLFTCDLLCIHANYHEEAPYPTKNLINKAFLARLKPGTVIINAARGGILDEAALIHRIREHASLLYCTDVYQNEPNINPDIVALATLCTPHIAGHTIEAKNRAVTMLSQKIHDYYGLLCPVFADVQGIPRAARDDRLLSHYDPSIETQQLKAAEPNKLNKTFFALRKAHCFRHDY